MLGRLLSQFKRLIIQTLQQLYAIQVLADSYPMQKGYLTDDVVQDHLKGKVTIAVVLLQPGTNVAKAGVIDFDKETGESLKDTFARTLKVKAKAAEVELESYIEDSGRRGFHLWQFAEQPLPGQTWVNLLKNLCRLAGHDAKEIFPSGATVTEEGQGPGCKPIKLPCGIHKGSGRRSGFLAEKVEWDEQGFPVLPEDQARLMEAMEQNPVDKLVALALLHEKEDSGPDFKVKSVDFSGLGPDQHPPCIEYLITKGAPKDQSYNSVNLTLARYAISQNLATEQAIVMAEQMAKATHNHSTSKGHHERVENFKGAHRSAKRNPDQYQWGCGYVRESKELLQAGGCPGWNCPFWPYGSTSQQLEYVAGPADTLVEKEFLAYLLAHAEALHEALGLEIPPEGFKAEKPLADNPSTTIPLNRILWKTLVRLAKGGREIRSSLILANLEKGETGKNVSAEALEKTADEYLQELVKQRPCTHETFKEHTHRLRDTGLRIISTGQVQQAIDALKNRSITLSSTLDTLGGQIPVLLRKTSSEIQPLEDLAPDLIRDLFGESKQYIPTPSEWLNNALNGGWQQGRLYILGAPPGAGKTTFAGHSADYAAEQGVPALFVSFEMSLDQLWGYSLARDGGINSALIERRRWQDNQYQHKDWLLTQVAKAAEDYSTKIAPKLTAIEAGPEVGSPQLKGMIAQVRHNAEVAEDTPILVIVDYLQLMSSGDAKLDSGANETLRVSRVVTSLKQLARDTKTAVLAISDITKESYKEAMKTGRLDMAALRDSFKIAHAADGILLLQTDKVVVRGTNEPKDQLELMESRYRSNPKKLRQIQNVRHKYPLAPTAKATYARLSIIKNRGGVKTEPLFVYEKAYHRFFPVDLDLGGLEEDDDDLS